MQLASLRLAADRLEPSQVAPLRQEIAASLGGEVEEAPERREQVHASELAGPEHRAYRIGVDELADGIAPEHRDARLLTAVLVLEAEPALEIGARCGDDAQVPPAARAGVLGEGARVPRHEHGDRKSGGEGK